MFQNRMAGLAGIIALASSGVAAQTGVQGFPRTVAAPDTAGNPGAPNTRWVIDGAPADGLDAMTATLVPLRTAGTEKNFINWAYNGSFKHGSGWFFGLQHNGSKTRGALFTVFGEGSTSTSPTCPKAADGGPGSRCYINYPWQNGRAYTFRIIPIAQDNKTITWRGSVRDLTSNEETVIGDVVVAKARGLLVPGGVTFSEFYARQMPCAERPKSEALFTGVVGYRDNKPLPGRILTLNANAGLGGCNPIFYSNHKDYLYLEQGTTP